MVFGSTKVTSTVAQRTLDNSRRPTSAAAQSQTLPNARTQLWRTVGKLGPGCEVVVHVQVRHVARDAQLHRAHRRGAPALQVKPCVR